jgi:anti-sigma factor (TIGR02949 family)
VKQVDCEDVKRNVHEYLHSAMVESELEVITAHIANCDSCEQHYDIEVVFNQVIQRSCDEAPTEELAERVMRRLREAQDHDGSSSVSPSHSNHPRFSTSQAISP